MEIWAIIMFYLVAFIKGTPWDETFYNVVNFENLTYMKLYSLLI